MPNKHYSRKWRINSKAPVTCYYVKKKGSRSEGRGGGGGGVLRNGARHVTFHKSLHVCVQAPFIIGDFLTTFSLKSIYMTRYIVHDVFLTS